MQRYVDAVGGQAAIRQIQTRTIEAKSWQASFKPGEPNTYNYRFKWRAPNKVVVKFTHIVPMFIIPIPFMRATFIFDGKAWSNSDGRTSRNEENTPSWRTRLRSDYPYDDYPDNIMHRVMADPLMVARAGELYSSFEADRNATSFPGLCILHANGTDEWRAQHRDTLYFDAVSGFLKSWEIQIGAPNHPPSYVHFKFDDYRQVGAVKIPFYVFFDFYEAIFRYTKVVHNTPLPDSDFVPKPAMAVPR